MREIIIFGLGNSKDKSKFSVKVLQEPMVIKLYVNDPKKGLLSEQLSYLPKDNKKIQLIVLLVISILKQ